MPKGLRVVAQVRIILCGFREISFPLHVLLVTCIISLYVNALSHYGLHCCLNPVITYLLKETRVAVVHVD
jgi:hypothetical protein